AEPSNRIGAEERVPSELRLRQRGVEEEGPSTVLYPTKQSNRVLPANRTNREPQALRHRRGIDQAHLRFWVGATAAQRPGPASRSLKQLDPDPVVVLDVDFGAFGVLRWHRGLRSFSDQLAVGLPDICSDEG